MKIEITNGYVEIRDSLSRKAHREYRSVLLCDVMLNNSNDVNKSFEIRVTRQDEAQEILVLAMLQKAFIGGNEVAINQDLIDELSNADFEKISKKCDELMIKKETEKKS